MIYDHSRKAGNCGDVWKHHILVALSDMISAAFDSFRYVESHAGAPVHRLNDNGEWRHGIGKIIENSSCDCQYTAFAEGWLNRQRYPAGWVFAADRLARRFKNIEIALYDTDEDVARQYLSVADIQMPPNVHWEFDKRDGYCVAEELDGAGADLVFLDPPYHPNANKDWRRLINTCNALRRKKIKFAAWYPIYWPTRPEKLCNNTQCVGWEVIWKPFGPKPSQNIKGCGMLLSDNLATPLLDVKKDIDRLPICMNWEFTIRQWTNP